LIELAFRLLLQGKKEMCFALDRTIAHSLGAQNHEIGAFFDFRGNRAEHRQ
jgi:hypothetical protein